MKTIYTDIFENNIRLTEERWQHIIEREEMIGQEIKIGETLALPDIIKRSNYDSEVYLYYKFYPSTPVTSKYLVVIAKITEDDAFILSSFFTDKIKSGETQWQQ
ncbi:MAG: hypothetical protein KGZ58_10805 [Ignavibacteriales bacterium]|nr:hypothetical protein [Ignavibacteriales bacterium]